MKKNKRTCKNRRWMLAGGLTALVAVGAVAAWRAAHPGDVWHDCDDCEPDMPEHMASPTGQCPCDDPERA